MITMTLMPDLQLFCSMVSYMVSILPGTFKTMDRKENKKAELKMSEKKLNSNSNSNTNQYQWDILKEFAVAVGVHSVIIVAQNAKRHLLCICV